MRLEGKKKERTQRRCGEPLKFHLPCPRATTPSSQQTGCGSPITQLKHKPSAININKPDLFEFVLGSRPRNQYCCRSCHRKPCKKKNARALRESLLLARPRLHPSASPPQPRCSSPTCSGGEVGDSAQAREREPGRRQ